VAHVCQELALGPVGFFGLFSSLLGLFDEPGVANSHRGAVRQGLEELDLAIGKVVWFVKHNV